ncbi:Hsp33 family molecular chaperone HslO, partial [Bacillus sp. SIMBA_161]
LTVSKDIGLQHPYVGQVPIVSGELGDDFTHYIVTSEQTPSSVGVGVIVNPDNTILASGGFLIQLMPGTDEKVITQLEQRLTEIPTISNMVRAGLTPEDILDEVLGKENVK